MEWLICIVTTVYRYNLMILSFYKQIRYNKIDWPILILLMMYRNNLNNYIFISVTTYANEIKIIKIIKKKNKQLNMINIIHI